MVTCRASVSIVTVALLIQVATSATYTVGGPSGGWDLSTDLKTWASAQKFVPGDSLTFTYASSHDVVEVTKTAYDACTATGPLQSYNGGNTVVKLSAPGKRYFICGIIGHCTAGMKLEVNVVSAASTPPKPAAPAPKAAAPTHSKLGPTPAEASSPLSNAAPSSEPPAADLVLAPASLPISMPSAAHGLGLPKLAIGCTMGMLMALAL